MSRQLVVVGASGFGRETIDVIAAVNARSPEPVFDVVGVLDDLPSVENLARLERRSVRYLGPMEQWFEAMTGVEVAERPAYVVGIGSPLVRSRLAARFEAAGLRSASVIHPTAVIGTNVHLGEGAVVCAGAILSTEVVLGAHCHVNPGAVIGHDTVLGDFVSVNPSATISGAVRISDRTLVGAGSVVLQGLRVGTDVTIGAAACVTRHVPDGVVVKGVPGRWYA